MLKKLSKFKKTNKGFTLVELVVVISIGVILTSIILINYSRFNDDLAISSAAQEMAIAIRQAQTYGLNVKEVSVGSGQFSAAYGIYFNPSDSPSDYYIFADTNVDKLYNPGTGCGTATTECIEKISLRNGVTITDINASAGCPQINAARSLHITFLRPNPDAIINFVNNGGNIVCSPSSDGQITLTSLKGKVYTVIMSSTGQVVIQ